jgi:TetR/AcrR family transcriptional repressor of nem operon
MKGWLGEGRKPNVAHFIDSYLAEAHRDDRADGCAVAALAGDASRKSAEMQAQFREHIEGSLEPLTAALEAQSVDEPRESAIRMMAMLYGALIMSRAVGDSALSREALKSARKGALKLATGTKKGGRRPRSRGHG